MLVASHVMFQIDMVSSLHEALFNLLVDYFFVRSVNLATNLTSACQGHKPCRPEVGIFFDSDFVLLLIAFASDLSFETNMGGSRSVFQAWRVLKRMFFICCWKACR
jgi:hypothetical protein